MPLLFYCWFPPECFLSHLLHYSLYIDSFLFLLVLVKPFLHLLNPCLQAIYLWFHFAFKILDHFHYHYSDSLLGRFPISSSFVWFGGHLSCSFTCWVFLCLFILFILLCLGWPFRILAVCGSSLLWSFLTVGAVWWVACQGFLVRETCVGVLVGGAEFLLSGVQWSIQWWVMRCQWFWSNFGQPLFWSSGLCSCVAGEFAWYVLLWNLLALGWCLFSV